MCCSLDNATTTTTTYAYSRDLISAKVSILEKVSVNLKIKVIDRCLQVALLLIK